jgi:hypothetical protein
MKTLILFFAITSMVFTDILASRAQALPTSAPPVVNGLRITNGPVARSSNDLYWLRNRGGVSPNQVEPKGTSPNQIPPANPPNQLPPATPPTPVPPANPGPPVNVPPSRPEVPNQPAPPVTPVAPAVRDNPK